MSGTIYADDLLLLSSGDVMRVVHISKAAIRLRWHGEVRELDAALWMELRPTLVAIVRPNAVGEYEKWIETPQETLQ